MPLTTPEAVQGVLGPQWNPSYSVQPFIATAEILVADAAECAAEEGVTFTQARKEMMERWVAAFLYTHGPIPTYKSRSTADASATWNTDAKDFLKGVYALDPTGCLAAIMEGKTAKMDWLGKTEHEQIDYVDRNISTGL